MIVPQPKLWTAGEAPDADMFNDRASAVQEFLLEPPMAEARQTVVQNVPTGSWTVIQLDTTDKDNDGIVDLANDKFVIQTPGWYEVTVGVGYNTGTTTPSRTGRRIAAFAVNGAIGGGGGIKGRRDCTPSRTATHSTRTGGSLAFHFLNANDYIQLVGWQDSGETTPTYVSQVTAQPFMSVRWFSN